MLIVEHMHASRQNTELHVIPGNAVAIITAQGRSNHEDQTGYVFVHSRITGTGGKAYLGRAWMPAAKVIFAYTTMSDAVNPKGWSDNFNPGKTVLFGEYQCRGFGARTSNRVKFAEMLTTAQVQPYIDLNFIQATKWLLPPPKI
ncbi:hypothetical protein Ancab_001539 [Ancistrocladus abbreviatus]